MRLFHIAKLNFNLTHLNTTQTKAECWAKACQALPQTKADLVLFSDNTGTHLTRKVVKWNKTPIEEFEYLPSSASTQYQLQVLRLKS